MKVLGRAAALAALACLLTSAEAGAQVGRRIGGRSEIVVPVEVPPAPPEVAGPANPAEGDVLKCAHETPAVGGAGAAKDAPGQAASGAAQDAPAETVYRGSEVDAKAAVSFVPEPGYTREARFNGTSGSVALRLTLHSTGEVSEVKVLRALPDGLTKMAAAAACRVEFTPARKDGRAVSQYVMVEFNFEADGFLPGDDSRLPPPGVRRLPPGTRGPAPRRLPPTVGVPRPLGLPVPICLP